MTWVILTGRQSDLDAGRDAAQDHHQPRLPRASGAVSRPAAEGDQPVQQLRLPEPRLLCLAAGQLARTQGHPDGRDDHRPVGAQALRTCAAGTGAGAEQVPQGARRRLSGQVVVLLRHRAVQGLGPLRQAPVRLVPRAVAGSRRSATAWNGRRSARSAFLPVVRHGRRGEARFLASLDTYTNREWRDTKARTPARYTFATLVDPHEELPPSEISSLRYWAKIAEKMGVEVEPITKKDLAKLANYDALFIRETTSISNHTYRFARRAQQEGMPVIDDPLSMIRCTNKVYLNELMAYNKVPVPPTVMIASPADFEVAAETLGFPLVLKIPDSAFSRGVKKAVEFRGTEDARRPSGWRIPTFLSRRNSCRPNMTGASACSAASRCLPSTI